MGFSQALDEVYGKTKPMYGNIRLRYLRGKYIEIRGPNGGYTKRLLSDELPKILQNLKRVLNIPELPLPEQFVMMDFEATQRKRVSRILFDLN